MMRPTLNYRAAFRYTEAASLLAVITAVVARVTATEATGFVNQALVITVLIFIGSLLLDLPTAMASATVPLVAVVMVEASLADDPTWIRSLVLGCLWFVTVEFGREAIQRRDGSAHTRAATARRVQELAIVILLSLVVGVASVLATQVAPVRTVLLQAVILGLVLAAFIVLIQRVALDE